MTLPFFEKNVLTSCTHVLTGHESDVETVSLVNRLDAVPHERLLTPEDVAGILQIGPTRVYQLLGSGALLSVRIGSSRRIRRADVDTFIANLAAQSSGR